MAPEKVLTLPLSGEEIRKAILDRISQRLEKDGYLNTNLAYDYYECKITIDAVCHDVGRAAPVKVTETVTLGEKPDGELDQHCLLYTSLSRTYKGFLFPHRVAWRCPGLAGRCAL